MRYISLFSGIAGLDRAIDALGGECWVQIEKEPYCRSILDLRYPDVPKVDNIFGWHATADTVDLVIGGPPCQPVSHAGRRKGTEDDRWLWGEALRVVREAKPAMVFFENPMGLRTLGLDAILAELSEMGYGGAWEVVAAADVGAPHLRKRIFIMGIAGREGWEGPTRPKGNRAVIWPTPRAAASRTSRFAATARHSRSAPSLEQAIELSEGVLPREIDSLSEVPASWSVFGNVPTPTARLGGQRGPQAKRYFDPARSNDLDDYVAAFPAPGEAHLPPNMGLPWVDDEGVPDIHDPRWPGYMGDGLATEDVLVAPPNAKDVTPYWPTPSAGDNRDRGHSQMPAIIRRKAAGKQLNLSMTVSTERGALSPDWVSWLMGFPIGWDDINCTEPGPLYGWESEPAIPRVGLGIANRSKRLTALGNAVVPAQAMFAWQRLEERLNG